MEIFLIVIFSLYAFMGVSAILDYFRLWPLNDRYRFRKNKQHD